MYKQINDPFTHKTSNLQIIRIADNACIPFDPANTDYQAFLKYQAEGGKVYGADEEIPVNG